MKHKGLAVIGIVAVFLFSIMLNANASGIIKIGVLAPITGPYASEGQSIVKSVKLIARNYNEKGGILGKKVEVVPCDDTGKALEAAICARKLSDEGVIFVAGSYTSTSTQAAMATLNRAGIIQISPGTANSLVQHGYWNFFRSSVPDSAQARFTTEFLIKKQHYRRIAVITDYSTFSMGLTNAVVKDVKKLGRKIVYFGKIIAGSQNFTPILTTIKSYHPDVVFFGGMYPEGGLLVTQMRQIGLKADFVGGDGNDNAEFLKLAGKAAIGTYLIDVPHPDLLPYPEAKKFLKEYRETYHKNPASIWTLYTTDGARVVLYAIQQTKSLDTKKVAEFMHHIKKFPGITGSISFAPNGERLGSSFMAYRIGSDLKYHIVYRH